MAESPLAQFNLKLISGRSICPNPASAECFAVARDWITQCMASDDHIYCHQDGHGDIQKATKNILPTRLIDVGPYDGSENPRLILSEAIGQQGPCHYAALSHCWGGSDHRKRIEPSSNTDLPTVKAGENAEETVELRRLTPLTTVTSNLKDRMDSIPMETLPQTFKDAVIITRNLGLRFIWVDSLCIIQDSMIDWEYEAARMADIYKHSYITIAAQSGRNSHEGILKERIFEFDSIEVPFNSKVRNIRTSMYLRPVQDNWDTGINGAGSALSTRAWVLQESMLAPRTLHYGSQQMFWECKTFSHAEGDLTPILQRSRDREWSWSRNKRFLSDLEPTTRPFRGSKNGVAAVKNVLYMRWNAILENYTGRRMTNPSDVFPALAGLASEFNRRLNDQYVAGLWKADLHRGLLWRIEEQETCRAATPYRAPSWSWASKVGQIYTIRDSDFLVDEYQAELEVEVTLKNRADASAAVNLYGEVSTGILRLRARWISTARWSNFEERPWTHHFIPDPEHQDGYLYSIFDVGTEAAVAERHEKGRTLSLVQIVTCVLSPDSEGEVQCLILESGDDADTAVYTRVGVVQMYDYPREWIEKWETRDFIVA